MKRIIIHTDGGSRGNPGPAGIGAVIADGEGKLLKEITKFLGVQTNNFAEYEAVLEALHAVVKMYGKKTKELDVEVKLDSELVQRQLSGKYQIKDEGLIPQFIAIHNLHVSHLPHLTFTHVRREKNREADKLANKAMDDGE